MAETTGSSGEGHESDREMNTIVAEEERVLSRVQKHVAARELRPVNEGLDYDAELLSLRNQIQEARLEDVPPLIEEMERLSEVAARRAKVQEGAVDPFSPYFGRLVLEENDRKREVLIGKSTYLDSRTGVRIVDWRDAPVSRIYYRYEEGDSYDETFGGREVQGEVLTRRSIAIASGLLRRIGSPQGTFVRAHDGTWRQLGTSASRLSGGQGAAMRPEGHHAPDAQQRGRLGTGVEGREDRFLPEITALIDPRQFELITRSDAGLVVIQGGAGSGKTTIGLHRLAYLAFQDPARFRPDRMLVIVYNDALVRYISRVIPSLLGREGKDGSVPVTTFERWAEKQRVAHVRGLPQSYAEETPTAVTKLKKSAALLRMIDDVVRRASANTRAWLEAALGQQEGKAEVLQFWDENDRVALGVRLTRLTRWVAADRDDDDAGRAAPAVVRSAGMRQAIDRVADRARRELLDVVAAWAEMLTDRDAIAAAFAKHAPGELDEEDLRSVRDWCVARCGAVLHSIEQRRDEANADEPRKQRMSARPPGQEDAESDDEGSERLESGPAKPKMVARKRGGGDEDEDDEPEDDRSVGVDGATEAEFAMLDREDDAILLRLVQRLRGPLVRGREPLRYEHILIDEAQDLSPVELSVIMGCTTKARSVTMAGDTAQRLHMDNGFRSWNELLSAIRTRRDGKENAFEPISVEPLRVQYRSTHPIIELAQEVLGPLADPESGNAIRDGAPVELFRFAHSGEAVAFLGEALRELMRAEPRASIALIARYPEQADIYYKGLVNAEVPYLRRIAEQDFPFKPGIDVTDVRQVKGLEFDYVVLLEVSAPSYPLNDESRHLLHIAATRAAHQLWLTCSGEPSKILPERLLERAY